MKRLLMKSTEIFPVFDVNAAEQVFGAQDIFTMMPEYKDIPDDYKMNFRNPAVEFVTDWFYNNLKKPEFIPREGIDSSKALRHIATIMASFAPKHTHKMASCAWLLDQWFSSYKNK